MNHGGLMQSKQFILFFRSIHDTTPKSVLII